MIEGVTKPFEIDAPEPDDTEKRAAAAAYISGMDSLFGRFGSDMLQLEVPPRNDAAEDESEPIDVTAMQTYDGSGGILMLYAPDSQRHDYGTDAAGVLRRSDSSLLRQGQYPAAERFGGTRRERFWQSVEQADRERSQGLNDRPVDAEEVAHLFALLAGARRTGRRR